ncbi:MAG: hypothetical protein K8S25_01090 [Alphaproteobacteria bacterium]|nr:hypothetical protein [Alphaproteobacteria bacterium]
MRAVFLTAAFVVASTIQAFATDRKVEDFYGAYLGHGEEEALGAAPTGDMEKQTRFSQVIIRPAAENGFTIEWATLKLKGDEIPREADTKSYTQTFRGTQKPNLYRDVTSGDPNLGADTSWAVINGDTMSVVQISVAADGGYFVTHYDRTLTEKGMDVRFTRFENSRIVRAVRLNLFKGPAKVN